MRSSVIVFAVVMGSLAGPLTPVAWADSAAAYCVLSQTNARTVPRQGACRWSQRQGNVTVIFQSREYDFPSDQEGRTYTRLNRDGAEAGPVFTKPGQYTLSVYWRKPAADAPGD